MLSIRRFLLGFFGLFLLVIGIALSSLTPSPINLLLAAAGIVILSLFPDRLRDLIIGKKQPTVSLEPLQILRFGPRAKLESSQWVNMAWASTSTGQKSLTALFGVIRVRAIGGDAIECRVASRVKIQDFWLDSGNLNWYSPSLIRNLPTIPDFQVHELNRYLANSSEHIVKDESKDLLVFYMSQGSPAVWVCSDIAHSIAGNVQNDQPLHFQIELSMTAQHEPKIVAVFDVEATWGRFLMARAVTSES